MEIVYLKEENAWLKSSLLSGTLKDPEPFREIITQDPRMESVFRYLEILGPTSRPALITGETGTGKELLAEAVHKLSKCSGNLVKIIAAGLDDTMFSDTLSANSRPDGEKFLFSGLHLSTLKEAEELLVEEALTRSGGNISKAAVSLGISQPALSKRLSKRKE